MQDNPICRADSYKISHWKMFPPDADYMFSYLESRGGRFPRSLFFGLQYYLHKLAHPITQDNINEAAELTASHLHDFNAFNLEGWKYIHDHHNGYPPVSICAVPEGTHVENGNILMSVTNTDPKCAWLVNYLESRLMRIWYPISVATLSWSIREKILPFLIQSGTPGDIDFKLHDFGGRSSTCDEGAELAGAAHLVCFKGTDTFEALRFIRKYYGPKDIIAGHSVAAAEHSTITSWGRDFEYISYKNILSAFRAGPISIVADSYDVFNACDVIFGQRLKGQIVKRDGVLVVRPDSGEIIPTVLRILEILASRFGAEENEKGYRVLPNYIRVLQGDGMNDVSLPELLGALQQYGYSSDNMATLGMGTKLHMDVNRDTQKMAFKLSAVHRSGAWQDVYKEPITDPGKKSKRGRLALTYTNNGFKTVRKVFDRIEGDRLVEVFRNGKILKHYDFPTVRENALKLHY